MNKHLLNVIEQSWNYVAKRRISFKLTLYSEDTFNESTKDTYLSSITEESGLNFSDMNMENTYSYDFMTKNDRLFKLLQTFIIVHNILFMWHKIWLWAWKNI